MNWSPRRRLAALVVLGILPWSVVLAGELLTVVFAFGMANPEALRLTRIDQYVFVYTRGLPLFLLSWPIGVVLYLFAVGSAAFALLDREDPRVTASLLVLVGLTQVSFAWGFSRRIGYVAVPLAAVFTWTFVWWVYWPRVRAGSRR
jgi:uncharacterized protein (TIGR04206 family)